MDFRDFEQRFSAWKILFSSGEITREEFLRHIESLTGESPDGTRWRINPQDGTWLKIENAHWIPGDPYSHPLSQQPVAPPSTLREATDASQKPEKVSFPTWLAQNWGWAAVLGAGTLLIAASIFFLVSMLLVPDTTDSVAQSDINATVDEVPTATTPPVDIQSDPSESPPASDTPSSQISEAGHEMVLIDAATFRMGTTLDELRDLYAICGPILGDAGCKQQGFEAELPSHQVTLDAYYIDVYETTNEQFVVFLNEQGNQDGGGVQWYEAGDPSARITFADSAWSAISSYGNHPATEVTWFGAQGYCEWRGGRLPTEAEWEMAARYDPVTQDSRIYPWGATQPTSAQANYGITGTGTKPVGSYEDGKSTFGLYDMAGNVFEWVIDWSSRDYGEGLDQANPSGPETGTQKIIRGGSWGDNAFLLRTANRGSLLPTAALNFVGFRCVKDANVVNP